MSSDVAAYLGVQIWTVSTYGAQGQMHGEYQSRGPRSVV